MGTISSIRFYELTTEGEKKPIVNVYQQYDGYPSGVGRELAEWLLSKRMVNGFDPFLHNNDNFANGVGCLAASFVHDFKTEIGNLYLYPFDADKKYVDYNYYVVIPFRRDVPKTGIPLDDLAEIKIRCWGDEEPIFFGKPSELLKWIEDEGD